MDQRVSFITLAVADLDRTRAFYVDGLGWKPEVFVPDEVLMIRVGDKSILSLWSERGFEAEVGPIRRGEGIAPITLSHNVATEPEVDEILELATSLGAEASTAAAPRVGRLHRLLRRPGRVPLGDRHQPGRDRPARPAVSALELRPFEEEHLPLVQPWFEHDEVRLRLGGPEWPARALVLSGAPDDEEFRGRRVLRVHTWLGWYDGEPVGYLGGDVYDRRTVWDGSDPDHPRVTASEHGPAMGAAYVVAPDRWGRGLGAALLRAWVDAPEVADVRIFELGIDDDNLASRRCAERAGFRADDDVPDWEGTVHFTRRVARP